MKFANGDKHWYVNGLLHREGGPAIERADGGKQWYLNGQCHREDGPALEFSDGTKYWLYEGKSCTQDEFNQLINAASTTDHVSEKPPLVTVHDYDEFNQHYKEGNWTKQEVLKHEIKYYNQHGLLHRVDGPAVIYTVGDDDMRHGRKEWYLNGQLHRVDGPAIDDKQQKRWYLNGQRHRTDGPAIEYTDGWKEWWVNGQLHREDGPAMICPDFRWLGNKYWLNGKRNYFMGVTLPLKKFFGNLFS